MYVHVHNAHTYTQTYNYAYICIRKAMQRSELNKSRKDIINLRGMQQIPSTILG